MEIQREGREQLKMEQKGSKLGTRKIEDNAF